MGNLTSKIFLVKPYLPDPSIDWEKYSLATTRDQGFPRTSDSTSFRAIFDLGQDFVDPVVNREFEVYMNRDIAPFICALLYASASFFYLTSIMNVEQDKHLWGLTQYAATAILLLVVVLDIYGFVSVSPDLSDAEDEEGLRQRKKFARLRHVLKFFLLLGGFLNMSFIPDFSLRKRNCIDATDWMAIIGLREKWAPSSPTDWTNNCPRSFHPFPVFFLTIVVVAAAIPTRWIGVFVTAFLLTNFTSDQYYPYEEPLSARDVIFKILLYIAVAATGAACHASRWWSAMSQFKQQLVVVQETSRATKSEREVENLLQNILPPSALNRLARNEIVADSTPEATVLFSDVKGFTNWSSTRTAREVVALIETLVLECDELCNVHGVEKVKTIGDAYWAVAGVPDRRSDHAVRMCNFALDFQLMLRIQSAKHPEWGAISIRIGIHSGPLDGAILGKQQLSYEVFGDTNTIANKAEQFGVPGEVCVTEDTLRSLGLDPPASAVDEIPPEGAYWERLQEAAHLSREPIKLYVLSPAAMAPVNETRSNMLTPMEGVSGPLLNLRNARKHLFKGGTETMSDSTDQADRNEAALMRRYDVRKYKYIFPDFKDQITEDDFIVQLRTSKARYLVATRCFLVAIVSVVALALYTSETPKIAATVVVSVALVMALVDLALCRLSYVSRPLLPKIQSVLASTMSMVLVVATSLGFGASIATGTAAPVHFAASCMCLFGNVGYVSAAFQSSMYILGWILIGALEWNRFITPVSLLGAPLSACMYVFISVVMERTYRQHYLQLKVSRYFHMQQAQRKREREVLLRAMVPSHVVKDLTRWMSRGMKPEESIVTSLPPTCVAFLSLNPSSEELAASLSHSHSASSPVRSPTSNCFSFVDEKIGLLIGLHEQLDSILQESFNTSMIKIKTIGNTIMLAGPFQSQSQPSQTELEMDQSFSPLAHSLSPQRSPRHEYYSPPAAAAAFDENYKMRLAVKQTLLIAVKIRATVTANMKVGVHIGELVGAVLGKSRLCFDVFGDCVNTASRVMSTGNPGDISISSETHNVLRNSNAASTGTGDSGLVPTLQLDETPDYDDVDDDDEEDGNDDDGFNFKFFDSVELEAKGKGTITVYRLDATNAPASPLVPRTAMREYIPRVDSSGGICFSESSDTTPSATPKASTSVPPTLPRRDS